MDQDVNILARDRTKSGGSEIINSVQSPEPPKSGLVSALLWRIVRVTDIYPDLSKRGVGTSSRGRRGIPGNRFESAFDLGERIQRTQSITQLRAKLVALLVFMLISVPFIHSTEVERPPNILIIQVSNLGWSDLGFQSGDPEVYTPNIDQMAADGVRFPLAYSAAPTSGPARASLLTGRYSQRFGYSGRNDGPLPLSELTIAERLSVAGYRCGFIGVGTFLDTGRSSDRFIRTNHEPVDRKYFPDHGPAAHGFEDFWRIGSNIGLVSPTFSSGPKLEERKEDIPGKNCWPEIVALTKQFLEFENVDPKRPWFLYLSWGYPAIPDSQRNQLRFQVDSNQLPKRRGALASLAAMDDQVGKIRNYLRQLGRDSNTLIFFLSDNGAPLAGKAWNGSYNHPLVGEKGMLTEGGVRIPMVAVWPGMIAAGKVFNEPVSALDIAATLNASARLPPDAVLDGLDLLPYLQSTEMVLPDRNLMWQWRSQSAILQYPWKLIRVGRAQKYLFNVSSPQNESLEINLIESQWNRAVAMEKDLDKWIASLDVRGIEFESDEMDQLLYSRHMRRSVRRDGTTP